MILDEQLKLLVARIGAEIKARDKTKRQVRSADYKFLLDSYAEMVKITLNRPDLLNDLFIYKVKVVFIYEAIADRGRPKVRIGKVGENLKGVFSFDLDSFGDESIALFETIFCNYADVGDIRIMTIEGILEVPHHLTETTIELNLLAATSDFDTDIQVSKGTYIEATLIDK